MRLTHAQAHRIALNQHRTSDAVALAKAAGRGVRLSRRARSGQQNVRLPFLPPEDWHEPHNRGNGRYRFVIQPAGEGFRHVVTTQEVRERLSQLPAKFTEDLEVVQFSRMTRKKLSFPCYGMQWGSALYLYPIEDSLIEQYDTPPRPELYNEARMYGGRWIQGAGTNWTLVWTEEAIKDFYLNNILIHELGHLLDERNSNYGDRERFAEWFAVEYGYRATRKGAKKPVVVRHGRKR